MIAGNPILITLEESRFVYRATQTGLTSVTAKIFDCQSCTLSGPIQLVHADSVYYRLDHKFSEEGKYFVEIYEDDDLMLVFPLRVTIYAKHVISGA